MASKVLHIAWRCFKVLIILIMVVELLSFLAMTFHNYAVYGHIFSHVPVRYDPDALFLMTQQNAPPDFNSVSTDPKLNRTVWMFGGSTVRGEAHLDHNKTLPALLSKFLNERVRPYKFTVLNLGENGFNSVLESRYLHKTLTQTHSRPDIVIFYDGANESFQFAEYRQPAGHIGYRRLKAFIESYRMSWFGVFKPVSAAVHASYTNEFLDRIRMLYDPVKPDSPTLAKMVDLTVKRYDHVYKVVQCYGADFLLIWQPMLWVERCEAQAHVKQAERTLFVDTEKFPQLKQSVRITYDALEDALGHKPYFATFRNVLCNRTNALFRPDGIHLKYSGTELIADKIGELLRRRFPEKMLEIPGS